MLNKLTRVCLLLVLLFMLISCGQTGELFLSDEPAAEEEDKK